MTHAQVKYTSQVDCVDSDAWSSIIQQFEDVNVLQSWSYGVARDGRDKISHLVLKQGERIVAAAQVRLAGLPHLGLGVAYVGWGPVWKPRNGQADPEVFRQVIRALREEYAARRGLVVRVAPVIWGEECESYRDILTEEGYQLASSGQNFRTIIMDITSSLEEIEECFHKKWRKHLNRARKNQLEIIEGDEIENFDILSDMYDEMVKRKGFTASADIHIYRKAQLTMPPGEKAHVILCKVDGEVIAGALCSGLGPTGVDLFRATSNKGVSTYGSYLVQWKVLEYLKARGCQRYNLNGINPEENPGGYQFKSQMGGRNGKEVSFIGAFDAFPSGAKKMLFGMTERFIAHRKQRQKAAAQSKPSAESSGAEEPPVKPGGDGPEKSEPAAALCERP